MSAIAQWDWKKSTYTTAANNCVETKSTGEAVKVRDTKDHSVGVITVQPQVWEAFLDEIVQAPFAA